jgi:hypothetical protein
MGTSPQYTAQDIATELLVGVGTRIEHSRAVANQAATATDLLEEPWGASLADAAWLHDLGYAPVLAKTGFHPLDGARWLEEQGWRPEVCRLVAWHTRAGTEAKLRHLEHELAAEFSPPPELAQAILAWADLTSSPTGHACTPEDRIAEVLARYSSDSIVHQATRSNSSQLIADARLVETRLRNVKVTDQ